MTEAAAGRYMTFRLSTETYAVEILKVRELLGLIDITRVPGAPPFVRGVVNLRGKVVPVTDLRLKLGIADAPLHRHTVIMVVHGPHGPMGLLVDEMLDVVALGPEQIDPASNVTQGAFDASLLSGIGRHEERVIFLLELDRVLAASPAAMNVGT